MVKMLFQTLVCLLLSLLILQVDSQKLESTSRRNTTELIITSNYSFPFTVIDREVSLINFTYSFIQKKSGSPSRNGLIIIVSLENHHIAKVVGKDEFYIHDTVPWGIISIAVEGRLPGRTKLMLNCKDQLNASKILNPGEETSVNPGAICEQSSWQLFVERREKWIDVAFNVIVVVLVVFANVGMGAKVDLQVVKSELKRPVAPIIGLSSQFIVMPMISFALAYTMDLDPGMALGLFALGCAPGGSASNAYTFLLDGNVSLSVTMTLVSTIASLGLIPMWLFTLGRLVYSGADFKIPFENIFFSLLGIIVPVIVGIFLQRKFPKVAAVFIKAVKYIMVVFILFILTVGVYANLYVFKLLCGEVLLASALLPYLGFVIGGLAALIGRQNLSNIITIAIETGIQNTGIPIVLLRLSLPGPDKDTGIVAPVASAIFTPIPLIFGILFVQIRKRIKARKGLQDSPVGEFCQGDHISAPNKGVSKAGGDGLLGLQDKDDL